MRTGHMQRVTSLNCCWHRCLFCSYRIVLISFFQESLELQNRQARAVAVTSMSFYYNDVNKFLVGSEECLVYQGQRHGTKPGIAVHFDGHTGPITAVSTHRAAGGQVCLWGWVESRNTQYSDESVSCSLHVYS